MSSESPAAQPARGRATSQSPLPAPSQPAMARPRSRLAGRWMDAALVAAFLALTFLLGVFPIKDTDFWWHLRTGDLIRQQGRVPTADIYTFTRLGHPWTDLHWGFQILLSWG